MTRSFLYAKSPSSSVVGLNVNIVRIVRQVSSVSAKNESSPVDFGKRLELGVGIQRLSLMSAAAHGIDESFSMSASIMMGDGVRTDAATGVLT